MGFNEITTKHGVLLVPVSSLPENQRTKALGWMGNDPATPYFAVEMTKEELAALNGHTPILDYEFRTNSIPSMTVVFMNMPDDARGRLPTKEEIHDAIARIAVSTEFTQNKKDRLLQIIDQGQQDQPYPVFMDNIHECVKSNGALNPGAAVYMTLGIAGL